MAMTARRLRVCFLDAPGDDPWRAQENRFAGVARLLPHEQFDVTLATVAGRVPENVHRAAAGDENPHRKEFKPFRQVIVGPSEVSLLCGLDRAEETAPLRASYRASAALAADAFDVLVAPLRGGIAHGVLMDRATGSHASLGRVAILANAPSRSRLLDSMSAPDSLAPLVADALERSCLSLADRLLCPDARARARVETLGIALPVKELVRRSREHTPMNATQSRDFREIVFVGPLAPSSGLHAFLDAIEALAQCEMLRDRRVVFATPGNAHEDAARKMLGTRAAQWEFSFAVLGMRSLEQLADYVAGTQALAVFAARDSDEDLPFALAHLPIVVTRGYDGMGSAQYACEPTAEGLSAAMVAALTQGIYTKMADCGSEDWSALLREIAECPPRSTPGRMVPEPGVSVCTVSRSRPALLRQALNSIDFSGDVEAIVIDNASVPPLAPIVAELKRPIRTIRLDVPLRQTLALNRAAAHASRDILIFLDDDNLFTSNGLARLRRALAMGTFDIVVSTLEIFDDDSKRPPTGRLMFMGAAHSAGLFFNGFGDTAMALRREVFNDLGGFDDCGFDAPALDWVFLARAQAKGLRIGVLTAPAVRYRRMIGRDRTSWKKQDKETAKALVRKAYGSNLDAPFLAHYLVRD